MLGNKNALDFNIPISKSQKICINTSELILQAWNYLKDGANPRDIAASAQYALSKKIAELAISLADENGINRIGLSGGVAYNVAITLAIKEQVEATGKQFLQHSIIPPGDAGVSIGQCIFGAIKLVQK
jgi:hydrogenase maturation protein HypF